MIRRFLLCSLLSSCVHQHAEGFVAPGKWVHSPPVRDIACRGRSPLMFPDPRCSSQSFLLSSNNPTTAASSSLAGRKRLAASMAFLTGCANLAIFTKFRTFATMLTGNTMWMALSVTEGKYRDVAYYFSVIVSYLFGTAVFRRTDLSLRKQTLPVCAVMVATLFLVGDWVHYATLTRWIPMMLFAAAYGIINSLGTEVTGTLTFVVTGGLTRLVNQFVDRLSRTAGRNKLTEAQKTAVALNSSIYAGFFAGAAFATVLMGLGLFNRFGVFTAIGVAHAVLWMAHDMEALGGAWWLRKNAAMCDLDDDGELCEEI